MKWPGAAEFATRYRTRFGKEPTYHAANAYASMIVMAETAVKAAGKPQATRELLKAGQWNGIMGPVQFLDMRRHLLTGLKVEGALGDVGRVVANTLEALGTKQEVRALRDIPRIFHHVGEELAEERGI